MLLSLVIPISSYQIKLTKTPDDCTVGEYFVSLYFHKFLIKTEQACGS